MNLKNFLMNLLYGVFVQAFFGGLLAYFDRGNLIALTEIKSSGVFLIVSFVFLLTSIPLKGLTNGYAIIFLGMAIHVFVTGIIGYLGYPLILSPQFQVGLSIIYCLAMIAVNKIPLVATLKS